MKNYMPLNGLRWSRDSGSANCDMLQSDVLGRPGGGKIASEYYVLQEKSAMELHIAIYVLLHEVGIISNDAKVKVSNVVCSCKKLSDSFLASGRLDAEY